MKIKVAEATGVQLDWMVGVIEKMHVSQRSFQPSTNWTQGGPIIERERISPRLESEGLYLAPYFNGVCHVGHQPGPTYLIAAMRCYVASKLGDEVEVPEGLG